MALTAFSGITAPAITGSVVNNAQTMPATTAAPPATLSLRVGDRMVMFIAYNSSTASVSSVANTGTALTWQRLGSITTQGTNRYEIWYSNASTVQQIVNVTATLSASVTSRAEVHSITGNPGVPDTPVVAGGSSTTPSSGGATPTAANALLIFNEIHFNTSSPGQAVASPSTKVLTAGASGNSMNGTNNWQRLGGVPNAATRVSWGTITSGVWFSAGISVPGATVSLDDLTYILRDDGSGVLLNNPAQVSPPIYDINQVTGLDDSTVNSSSSQIDGTHGSYIMAKFLNGKTVAIDCMLYSTVPVDESQIDNLKYNYRPAPDSTIVPFFYKLPSKPLRWIAAKPLSFQCDMTRARTYGVIPFQLQFSCPDPRSYSLPVLRIQNTPTTSTQYDDFPVIGGNIETYPKFYFNVNAAEITNSVTLTFTNQTSGGVLIVNAGSLPVAGGYILDLAARSVTQVAAGDTDYSASLTTRGWWSLTPGLTNNVRLVRIGTGAQTTEGFSMSYADAWR